MISSMPFCSPLHSCLCFMLLPGWGVLISVVIVLWCHHGINQLSEWLAQDCQQQQLQVKCSGCGFNIKTVLSDIVSPIIRFKLMKPAYLHYGNQCTGKTTSWWLRWINISTVMVLRSEYSERPSPISWLVMSWLFKLPGHQHEIECVA